MAAIPKLNTTITDAVFVPEMWSDLVLRAREDNYVAAKLFERRDKDVPFGDKVHFPISSIGTAVDYTQGEKLEDKLAATTELEKTIEIDKYKVRPFLISDQLTKQSKYDQFVEEAWASGEAVAEAIDTDVLAETVSGSSTTAVGTLGTAITNLALTAAKRTLDVKKVPMSDRFWILDPKAEEALLNLPGNYFTSIDFSNTKAIVTGQVGRIILGSPAYFTNNLPSTTGTGAGTKNIYAHKQATGVAMQIGQESQSEPSVNFQGILGNVRALYGVGTLRPDHSVVVQGN